MKPEDLRAAYRLILDSDDGRVMLDDLERRFHIHAPIFSADPYETAFRDGQRSVVLMLQGMMRDTPQAITTEEMEFDV